MMSSAGLSVEIFWEIAPLNSVKIAEGPVWPRAVCKALAVALLVATAATERLTWRRIIL